MVGVGVGVKVGVEEVVVGREGGGVLVEQRLEGEDEDVRRHRLLAVDERAAVVGAHVDPHLANVARQRQPPSPRARHR